MSQRLGGKNGKLMILVVVFILIAAAIGIFIASRGTKEPGLEIPPISQMPTIESYYPGTQPYPSELQLQVTGAAPAYMEGEITALYYPGWQGPGSGLYDWIWKNLGYSKADAKDPNGSFVCVYLSQVREKGFEDQYRNDPLQPLTINIDRTVIEVCGGIR